MFRLLQMEWASFLAISFITFVLSYIIFGAIIWRWSFTHQVNTEVAGRLNDSRTDDVIVLNNGTLVRKKVCFEGVQSFFDAFSFAMETMSTIGYGTKYPNPKCPEAILLTMLVLLWSLFLTALFSGLFLAKFTRRTGKSLIRFSQKAVVSKRNGELFLMFRIADPLASGKDVVEVNGYVCTPQQILDPSDKLEFRVPKIDIVHRGCLALSFTEEGWENEFPLMWPSIIYHKIDQTSPLYDMDPAMLQTSRIEIIVNVTGVKYGTGGAIFSSTSFVNEDIVWGARLCEEAVLYSLGDRNIASIAQDDIDKIIRDDTPTISARELANQSVEEMYINILCRK